MTEQHLALTVGANGRPEVDVFLSYASADARHANELWTLLRTETAISRVANFRLWAFERALVVGEAWDERIRAALRTAHLGVFAMSSNFLASSYITGVELPAFLSGAAIDKRALPCLLEPLRSGVDQHGLDTLQIFHEGGRAFSRARGKKLEWAQAFVGQIEAVVRKYATALP